MLELDNVERRFGGVRAVDGISLSVAPGTILGLIGPNGSGKTTLLNLISATLKPSGGRITVDGVDTAAWSPIDASRAGVARAFQVPQVMDELSASENCMIGAMFGTRDLARREAMSEVDGFLEQVGLAAAASQAAGSLSLAERRRLELARLLAARPRLALVDEIMAGLSPAQVADVETVLSRLRSEDVALILVEHVPGVIARLADEICVLHQGRVLAHGTPEAILAHPEVIEAYLGRSRA